MWAPIVQHTACQALATFGQDAGELGSILLRMAFSNGSPSSAALSRVLLAFSSLHLHGNQRYAWEQKISALGTLSSTFKCQALDTDEASQHIASGMMLYSCEVRNPEIHVSFHPHAENSPFVDTSSFTLIR